jgi:hypothetical protein
MSQNSIFSVLFTQHTNFLKVTEAGILVPSSALLMWFVWSSALWDSNDERFPQVEEVFILPKLNLKAFNAFLIYT